MNKKLFFGAAAAVSMLLCSCGGRPPAENERQIQDFLQSREIYVAGSPSVKDILIPAEFGSVYERYNELQKKQGFDLYTYRNREAKVYTFAVVSVHGENRLSTEAHVIVCDDVIIGGDVASTAIDGEMTGF